jgi:hypothetical protein
VVADEADLAAVAERGHAVMRRRRQPAVPHGGPDLAEGPVPEAG